MKYQNNNLLNSRANIFSFYFFRFENFNFSIAIRDEALSNDDQFSELTAGTKRTSSTRRSKQRIMRRGALKWQTYLFKILKETHSDTKISKKAIESVNSFLNDVFDQICEEAFKLTKISNRTTLGVREVQAAIKLVLGQNELSDNIQQKYKKVVGLKQEKTGNDSEQDNDE